MKSPSYTLYCSQSCLPSGLSIDNCVILPCKHCGIGGSYLDIPKNSDISSPISNCETSGNKSLTIIIPADVSDLRRTAFTLFLSLPTRYFSNSFCITPDNKHHRFYTSLSTQPLDKFQLYQFPSYPHSDG